MAQHLLFFLPLNEYNQIKGWNVIGDFILDVFTKRAISAKFCISSSTNCNLKSDALSKY